MHVVMHCMVVMAMGLCVCKHSNCAFSQWRNFLAIVDKAKNACENAGMKVTDHFADVSKMIRNVHPRDSLWLKRLIELGATYSR